MRDFLTSTTKVQLKFEIEADTKLISESQKAIDRLKIAKTNKVLEQRKLTKNLTSVTKTVINLESNISSKQMRLDLLTTTVRFKRNLIGILIFLSQYFTVYSYNTFILYIIRFI